ncbi:MAG: DUF3293 domain-containing protein [Iamia sp.]
MTQSTSIWDSFNHTVLVTWDGTGLPKVLAGAVAESIPSGTLHAITGWNPEGIDADPKTNADAHRRLVHRLKDEALDWDPVVGASPDGSHHELGVITGDLSRTDAAALGAEFDQLAVFELDDEHITVVPCAEGPITTLDRWRPFDELSLTYDHVSAWRAEHEEITGSTLPRTRCPQCDTPDPQRFLYGMPARMPPDWMALGGCVVGPDQTHLRCRACGHSW